MFMRIAPSYDRLNRIMTFGQDRKWRNEAARALAVTSGAIILDLGSGTGDMIFEILRNYPKVTVVGIDFTSEMVQIGLSRMKSNRASWIIADVQSLPFPRSTFDGTISAFLMRNLTSVGPALKEQYRVLRDGGRLVCLDTSPPPRNLLYFLTYFYLNRVIPFMGGLISHDMDAYSYLAISTANFLTPDELAEEIRTNGFCDVRFVRRMFGTIAIHIAEKARKPAVI
jgi:demethylmenaquinone methyltransferase/2-methoxy-6-polyprenyl-1,4-benzoquinol methylase